MRKYCIFLIILIFLFIYYPREKYVELNHLAIIKEIDINCLDFYNVTLKEIIPEKKDNGIEYQYHNYYFNGDDLFTIKNDISNYKKKLYLKHLRVFRTNCNNYKDIKKVLNISPRKTIYK